MEAIVTNGKPGDTGRGPEDINEDPSKKPVHFFGDFGESLRERFNLPKDFVFTVGVLEQIIKNEEDNVVAIAKESGIRVSRYFALKRPMEKLPTRDKPKI